MDILEVGYWKRLRVTVEYLFCQAGLNNLMLCLKSVSLIDSGHDVQVLAFLHFAC